MTLAYWLVASYLLGSIPTSLIVSRYIARIELRHMGSGNLGATNVYRVLGWKYAIPVFVLDAAKGVIPVAVFGLQTTALGPRWTPIAMGIAAILGHVFSLFASFKGGKGVATTCGVVLALAPIPTAVSLAVWGLLSALTGYVSVGSIIGSSVFPIVAWIVYPGDTILTGAGLLMAGFLVFNHRGNIARLRAGTETRIRPPGAS